MYDIILLVNRMQNKDKLKISDLLWIFMVGGLFGYVMEITWYFIRKNVFLIKNGVLFGPFQPIYAIGVVLMTIAFYKVKDKNWIYIFLIGTFVGGLFEYGASVFQEYALGTYSWNYRKYGKLAINGRIYIPYCFGWGLMAIVWIKVFMERIIKLFRRIPSKINTSILSILTIFMAFNLICTSYVFYRKSARYKEIPPRNIIEKYIDEHYDDDYLDKRFPNLWLSKGGF